MKSTSLSLDVRFCSEEVLSDMTLPSDKLGF